MTIWPSHLCLVVHVALMRSLLWKRSGLWWYNSFMSSVTCTEVVKRGVKTTARKTIVKKTTRKMIVKTTARKTIVKATARNAIVKTTTRKMIVKTIVKLT